MLYDIINQLKKEKNITNAQLAEKSGITLSTIDKITAGINTNPKLDTLQAICKVLNCTLDDFDENSSNKTNLFSPSEQTHIKKYRELDNHGKDMVDTVLNKEHERILSYEVQEQAEEANEYYIDYYDLPASAGTGMPLLDDYKEKLRVPETPTTIRADFAVRVSGDSMEPKYYDGDILLVEETPDIEIGEIGIFILDGTGYVKKKGEQGLISLNKKYKPIHVHEYEECRCAGKVIGKL